MGKTLLKIFLAVGIVTALSLGTGDAGAHPKREPVHPHIISQRSEMVSHQYASATWERHIMLRNPLSTAVWLWVECESHLTTLAIGVGSHRTSEIVLPEIPPAEACVLHHWIPQRQGQSPPEWRP